MGRPALPIENADPNADTRGSWNIPPPAPAPRVPDPRRLGRPLALTGGPFGSSDFRPISGARAKPPEHMPHHPPPPKHPPPPRAGSSSITTRSLFETRATRCDPTMPISSITRSRRPSISRFHSGGLSHVSAPGGVSPVVRNRPAIVPPPATTFPESIPAWAPITTAPSAPNTPRTSAATAMRSRAPPSPAAAIFREAHLRRQRAAAVVYFSVSLNTRVFVGKHQAALGLNRPCPPRSWAAWRRISGAIRRPPFSKPDRSGEYAYPFAHTGRSPSRLICCRSAPHSDADPFSSPRLTSPGRSPPSKLVKFDSASSPYQLIRAVSLISVAIVPLSGPPIRNGIAE